MKQYKELIQNILDHGVKKSDRTGTGTISIFGTQSRYNLKEGFPLLTLKKMEIKSIVSELMWFLEGSTDERRLAELRYSKPRQDIIGKNTIWTDNANAQGVELGYENNDLVKELGPVYGSTWRDFGGVDQIKDAINRLEQDPNSRRHIVSAWEPKNITKASLPPCHVLFQFYINDEGLACQLYQR